MPFSPEKVSQYGNWVITYITGQTRTNVPFFPGLVTEGPASPLSGAPRPLGGCVPRGLRALEGSGTFLTRESPPLVLPFLDNGMGTQTSRWGLGRPTAQPDGCHSCRLGQANTMLIARDISTYARGVPVCHNSWASGGPWATLGHEAWRKERSITKFG